MRVRGSGFGVRSSRFSVLKFPELREFQKDVIGVQPRDDQAGRAVLDAAAQQVVAQKGQAWVDEDLEAARAASLRQPLFRRERRVAIDRREVMGDVAIRVMLKLLPQERRARGEA